MHNFQLTYAAFLFPAIPLMMLTFGNRWIAISKLIRQMHADFLDKRKRKSELAPKYLVQIKILNLRLQYVKYMQLFSGMAFILNLFTILVGIFGNVKKTTEVFFDTSLKISSTFKLKLLS